MITCLITGQPFPRGFRTFAISKIFINHVRIASLRGEISHVLVMSWCRGSICVEAINLEIRVESAFLKRLNLKQDELLLICAFSFNLRFYT